MKLSILLASGALVLVANSAGAAAGVTPKSMTICLDSGGRKLAAHCHIGDGGSRLDAREDVCTCPAASQIVKAPVCAEGMAAPAESAAYEQARLKAVSHGSVMDASWQGKPMCVAPINRQ